MADGGEVRAALALPLAGLMADRPPEEVADDLDAVTAAARQLGCSLGAPFMAMSFLALPVIRTSSSPTAGSSTSTRSRSRTSSSTSYRSKAERSVCTARAWIPLTYDVEVPMAPSSVRIRRAIATLAAYVESMP